MHVSEKFVFDFVSPRKDGEPFPVTLILDQRDWEGMTKFYGKAIDQV